MEVREILSEYGFDGDNTPVIKGSALKASEGDESDIGNIKIDQDVEFSTDAFPDRKLKAKITQIRYSVKDVPCALAVIAVTPD